MCLTCFDIGNDVQDDNDGGVDFDGEDYSNLKLFDDAEQDMGDVDNF